MNKENRWVIRNASAEVQKIIRVYAAEENITVAEALEKIIAEWRHLKAMEKLKSD